VSTYTSVRLGKQTTLTEKEIAFASLRSLPPAVYREGVSLLTPAATHLEGATLTAPPKAWRTVGKVPSPSPSPQPCPGTFPTDRAPPLLHFVEERENRSRRTFGGSPASFRSENSFPVGEGEVAGRFETTRAHSVLGSSGTLRMRLSFGKAQFSSRTLPRKRTNFLI
jgi:hypothetical protein